MGTRARDLVALSDAAWHELEREIVTRPGGTFRIERTVAPADTRIGLRRVNTYRVWIDGHA